MDRNEIERDDIIFRIKLVGAVIITVIIIETLILISI